VRRPLWYRALIAAWGIWFTAALTNAGGLHTCPTHGNHAAHSAVGADQASPSHDGAMAGMDHGAAGAATSTSSRSQDTQHGPNACTCLGSCCCAAPVAAPAAPRDAFVVALIDAPPADYPEVAAPSFEREYAHPFANGPPAQA
jgi:hypothetical protein